MLLSVLCSLAVLATIGAVEPPADDPVTWHQEVDEQPAPGRGRICLNGWWEFAPELRADEAPSYGWIRVPGSWSVSTSWQGCDRSDLLAHPGWGDFGDGKGAWRGHYRRPLRIPDGWSGRRVMLVLDRVSTDAQVFIDDQLVETVAWPRAEVDLSDHVEAGGEYRLRVAVAAIPEAGMVKQYMATATSFVIESQAEIYSRGLVGDVTLESMPTGAVISDLFVRPSVRRSEVALDVTLRDLDRAGTLTLTAEMCALDGTVEQSFEAEVSAVAAAEQTLSVSWPWADPRLWDIDQPERYRCVLSVSGAGIEDSYAQVFGFREFWIDGRQFMLNGSVIHLRPTLMDQHGMAEAIAGNIRLSRGRGRNIVELWPNDLRERTRWTGQPWLVEEADKLGFLVMANSPHLAAFVDQWEDPAARQRYAEQVDADLKRLRNHPSVAMYVTTGNYFGHSREQDPRKIGRRGWADDEPAWRRRADIGEAALDVVRKADPTRPVCTHNGAYVGDFQTSNNYLNLIALQEREDWLSHWARHGEMPFMAVEFETPVNLTLRRGRHNHIGANTSEPLLTEYCASYIGRAAWTQEDPSYRAGIVAAWRPDEREWYYGQPRIHAQATFQLLLEENITKVWRSWRTYGMSGGMIPWVQGHGYGEGDRSAVAMPPFVPGRRGTYHRSLPRELVDPEAVEVLPAGLAMEQANADELLWIAGPGGPVEAGSDETPSAAGFTAKDHSFAVGAGVEKSVVVINDGRQPRRFEASWSATLADREVDGGRLTATLEAGEIRHFPLTVRLPRSIDGAAAEGSIAVTATLGERQLEDRFAFRVFAPDAPVAVSLAAIDPDGDSSAMLRALGCRLQKPAQAEFRVIGRRALSGDRVSLAQHEDFIRAGGRLLVLTQDPSVLEGVLDLRVADIATRRVFALDQQHPLMTGLVERDLRDWTGASSLLPAFPTEHEIARTDMPWHGWRWGNRGTVSSAAIEVPHRSGWRPLLVTEFDWQYSPVMELSLGEGLLVLCQLDLEDHWQQDPAAARLARNLIRHVATVPIVPRTVAAYLGDETGAELLDQVGIIHRRVDAVGDADRLVIIGPGADVDPRSLAQGRSVLVLARDGDDPAGIRLTQDPTFGRGLPPDWPEAAGLTPANVRTRTDLPWTVLHPEVEIERASGGLLGRFQHPQGGVAIWCQADPRLLPVETAPWHRRTRWHQTRVIAQLAANLGATLEADSTVFADARTRPPVEVSLAGTWDAVQTLILPSAPSFGDRHQDPGLSPAAERALAGTGDFAPVEVPGKWEDYGGSWDGMDGEAVFRREITVPEQWVGHDLELSLGTIDDHDLCLVEGEEVGSTTGGWNVPRIYRIPARLVTDTELEIAVRVWDWFGGGGFTGAAEDTRLRLQDPVIEPGPYHPDHIEDFATGDDPYRYERW